MNGFHFNKKNVVISYFHHLKNKIVEMASVKTGITIQYFINIFRNFIAKSYPNQYLPNL